MDAADIVRVCGDVVPTLLLGSFTVTDTVPTAAISAAPIWATSSLPATTVVGRATPFHLTVEVFVNPVPSTVSMNPVPPTVTLVGEMDERLNGAAWIVKTSEFEVPLTGSVTDTGTLPAAAISAAVICVVSWVALT